MFNPFRLRILLLTIFLLPLAQTMADVRLADIFSDGVILQRQLPVPVWGWADPKANIKVSFGGQTESAQADDKGYWKVILKPMEASSEGREITIESGSDKKVVKDVLVGEVWLVAGQSNMRAGGPDRDTGVYPFYKSKAGGAVPEIRFREFGWGATLQPDFDVDAVNRGKDQWKSLPENPADMFIARYFARVVHDGINVPVGMIMVAVPGTNQAAWMSKETLESFPGKDSTTNFYEEFLAGKQAELAKGPVKSFADFKKTEEEWKANSTGPWPGKGLVYVNFPTALYNTRIFPLAPFAFRGMIWHQGEAGPGGPYGARLTAMFKQWRSLFNNDFELIWGTLGKSTANQPPLLPATDSFYRSLTNIEIRKALELFQGDKGAEYVEFYDLGNENTHFTEKAEAGRRMGLAALSKVYNQPAEYTAPRMVESKIEGNKATLHFEHTGNGLTYKPSLNGISGFIAAGADGVLQWANVKLIDSKTIECSLPDAKDLKVLGYAVAINPHETLFNSDGIPASPFLLNADSVRLVDTKPAYNIVKIDAPGVKVTPHLEHVRREGYVFELRKDKTETAEKAKIEAFVPDEWAGVEVENDGQPITFEAATENGIKLIRFEAPLNSSRIIVAPTGKAADLRKVDRF